MFMSCLLCGAASGRWRPVTLGGQWRLRVDRAFGIVKLGPEILPVVRAQLLQVHGAICQSNHGLAMLSWNSAHFPVADGGTLYSQKFREFQAASNQLAGHIHRMALIRVRYACLMFHAPTLTRFVFINQHHVLTRYVFNLMV